MAEGWQYRVASVGGTAVLVGAAVFIANLHAIQVFVTTLPPLEQLSVSILPGSDLTIVTATAMVVILLSNLPLFKPRPRRNLAVLSLVFHRLFISVVALAAIGYFDYTYRLPRSTLLAFSALLALLLPAWFLLIQPRTADHGERAIVVGDDPEGIQHIIEINDIPIAGYVSPLITTEQVRESLSAGTTDGGRPVAQLAELEWLGGLSRLEQVLLNYDIDTVVLSFAQPDRAEFFGVLATCYECDVSAKVPRNHADAVLSTGVSHDHLVDIELDPWDPQDRILKRGFDILFATGALLILSPLIVMIAILIKAEDGGEVFYCQERTAAFGETFIIWKFRTMRTETEDVDPSPHDEDDERVTVVGQFLRDTHLDEIPQLWSILLGDMSLVGPRAVWTKEENVLKTEATSWRKRWFVRPGLTGLAQINQVSSTDPETKLRYDIEYIRNQSFWLDLKIVVRQLWIVGRRVSAVMRGKDGNSET